MRKLVLILVTLTLTTLTAAAQSSSLGEGSGELYFGYSHVTGDIGKNGWNLTGAYNLAEHVAGEADFGGYYGSASALGVKVNNNEHSFLFGPKVMFSTEDTHFTPWAHLLIGAAHASFNSNEGVSDSDTSFAWVLGGGVDYNLSDNFAARAKLDLYHTNYFSNGDSHARVGLGIVYKFGQ